MKEPPPSGVVILLLKIHDTFFAFAVYLLQFCGVLIMSICSYIVLLSV